MRFTLEVQEDASGLSFQISGGSIDAEPYAQYSAPTLDSYDCRLYVPTVATRPEPCRMLPQGTWHALVYRYTDFANVSLMERYTN